MTALDTHTAAGWHSSSTALCSVIGQQVRRTERSW
jgi:hypothetical protein